MEQKFTIVHYDQRGTGKSYHFFQDYSNLSPELLSDDLIALTGYIRKRFGKDKVLLAGHSFGSYIGMVAAAKAPENYIAYIGIGQVSNFNESETDSLTMNYKGLQKRSKSTTKNKTGKFNKVRRFGKSLANKAPSMFLTILDNKLKWNTKELYKIDTTKIKASQYNHFDEKYSKKELSERWNDFGEFKLQRDLYSSFLIMNVKDNLKEIDRGLCFKEFDNFKQLHDKEISRLLSSNNKKISSMGI